MSKTLTIELPDGVAQQLKAFADSGNIPLSELIVKTLYMFASATESIQSEDSSSLDHAMQVMKERIVKAAQLSQIEAVKTAHADRNPSIQEHAQRQNSDIDTDYDALLALAGTLELGTTDLGENHDRYIAEALERELTLDE